MVIEEIMDWLMKNNIEREGEREGESEKKKVYNGKFLWNYD
jgi:hypothetical protein